MNRMEISGAPDASWRSTATPYDGFPRRVRQTGLLCLGALLSGCAAMGVGAGAGPEPANAGPAGAGARGARASLPPVVVEPVVLPSVSPGAGDSRGAASAASRNAVSSPSRPEPLPPLTGGSYFSDDGPGSLSPTALSALAALDDPQPADERLVQRANRPYRVMGRDYVPMTRRESVRQVGRASWYGRKFHGRPTSIGERYDMYAMTAAHPTFPLPSYARVTNRENGRSVVVRVNDRGPFLQQRVIDLSLMAAYKLGYAAKGHAEVDVELLPTAAEPARPGTGAALAPPTDAMSVSAAGAGTAPVEAEPARAAPAGVAPAGVAPAEAPSAPGGGAYFVQVAAFNGPERATVAREQLGRQLEWLSAPLQTQVQQGVYRLRVGPISDREEAERLASRIRSSMLADEPRARPFVVPAR